MITVHTGISGRAGATEFTGITEFDGVSDRSTSGGVGAGVDNLLLEDGSNFLLEDGTSVILLE